jgi:hypothetical protein
MQRSALLAFTAAVAALSSAGAPAADAPPLSVPPTITSPAQARTVTTTAPATPLPSSATPSTVPAGELLEEVELPHQKGGEPAIKRTVIEDRAARIEELRVRGTLQKVTVAPKGGAPGYEVLTGDGYHATADDPGTSRGSAGKRVWNVLRF